MWIDRVKNVEREYSVVLLGIARLNADAKDDPSILPDEMRIRDISTASNRLEGTYTIRLFAEFESALAHFMLALNMRRPYAAEALINRVRDKARIAQFETDKVHRVREFRNALVHDRLQKTVAVPLREATSSLCGFLSALQRIW